MFRLKLWVALTVAILSTGFPRARGQEVAQTIPKVESRRVCAPTSNPHAMSCLARVVTSSVDGLPKASGAVTQAAPSGYGPADLQDAYQLTALSASAGSGRTMAIVDAQDDPTIEADLALYRSTFGLPPCTSASGCFQKVNQNGAASPLPTPDTGWSGEIALDLEIASAICPNCNLLLLEANSPNNSNLDAAENTAAAWPGVVAISNSWGGLESSTDPSECSSAFNHPGMAITFSSGDDGYDVLFPAACGYVTAVGGTSLLKDSSTPRGWSESVWFTTQGEGTGSGCSQVESKPSWQTDSGCLKRTVGDVSAIADPGTGVAVYDSYGSGGWAVYGGTSASAPLVAGVYAMASSPAAGDYPASYPYANPGALFDVTSGHNGTNCGSAYLCTAEIGYDGPTGWGTPNGVGGFQPVSVNDFSITASPGSLSLLQGTSGASTISTAITSGGAQTVNLSVSGVPAGATATLAPASVTSGGSSTLTVNAGTAAAGTYTLTILGTGTSATHSTTVSLTVTAPVVNDFSISANPASLNLTQGTSGTSMISTVVTSGNSQTVNLTISGLPAGATAAFSPSSIASGASSTLTVNAGTAAPGAYTLTITGTGTSTTHSTSVTLTVTPSPADFAISASPASLTVGKGGIGAFKVTVSGSGGFNGLVALSVNGFPSRVIGAFVPNSVKGSGTSYLIFVVGLKQAGGTFPLTITGTSGSLVHSTNVTLNVK